MGLRRVMNGKWGNWLLALVSTLFFLTVVEFTLWRPNLMLMPLALHQQLGFLDILAQSSKMATLPSAGYVAVIGDSYAEGLGDWLMEEIGHGNPPYSSAHVLHAQTGRDVLSFGFRGGHPAWTYSFEVTAAQDGINRYHGLELPPAGDVFAFFYEGNDINDLMAAIDHGAFATLPPALRGNREAVANHIRNLGQNGHDRAWRRWTWAANLSMADTFGRLVKLATKNTRRNDGPILGAEDPMFRVNGYQPNWSRYQSSQEMVLVGGKPAPYPSPSVEPFVFHSDDEIAMAALYFEESLAYLRTRFPEARIHVVYIPSPITAYQPVQADYPLQDRIRRNGHEQPGAVTRVPRAAMAKVSDATCDAMAAAARAQGAGFVDTRLSFRKASAEIGYIHGPNDPGHLNRLGYETLARILAGALASPPSPSCATLL